MSEEERKQIAQTAEALLEEAAQLIAQSNRLQLLVGNVDDHGI